MNNCSLMSVNTRASRPGQRRRRERSIAGDWLENQPNQLAMALERHLAGGGPFVFDDGYHKFSCFTIYSAPSKKSRHGSTHAGLSRHCQDCPAVVMWKYRDKKLYGTWGYHRERRRCTHPIEILYMRRTDGNHRSRGVLWLTRCTLPFCPTWPPSCHVSRREADRILGREERLAGFVYRVDHDFIVPSKRSGPVLSGPSARKC
jgi:hypothetical protein